MAIKLRNVQDVAEYQLCCGCGACAYISPDEIEMVDAIDYGRRPIFKHGGAPRDPRSEEAMHACPGIGSTHSFDRKTPGLISELMDAWGPIYEVWEGYASDPDIRFMGSSGGVATALALYCVEKAGFYGVLHTAAQPHASYFNHTVLSTTHEELLAATGSRYSPASPCEGLQRIECAPGPCVFIGKPCDVGAMEKARKLRPALDAKVGLSIAIFCAGTPSTKGTLEMLKAMGIEDPSTVRSLRYRGRGWPGRATVEFSKDRVLQTRELTYQQAWGEILQNYRLWRCHICPDHSGEFADIAVGDPWYRELRAGEPGQSLVLVRTERGRRMVGEAMRSGYLSLEPVGPKIVVASQPGFPATRGALWGRLLALRFMGVPVPRFQGMPMLKHWWAELTLKAKAQSIFGTVKRVFARRLLRRHPSARRMAAASGPNCSVAEAHVREGVWRAQTR